MSVKEKHTRYIIQEYPLPESDPDIRPEILASWRRCIKNKDSILNNSTFKVENHILQKIIEENSIFLQVAREHLKLIYENLKDTGIFLTISNQDGTIIDYLGDDTTAQITVGDTNLYLGCIRSENQSGTTAIALTLHTQKPAQVFGAEHFRPCFHNYIGSAAPICDESGNIIAALGSLVPIKQADQYYLLSTITMTAKNIEKELSRQKAFRQLQDIKMQLETTIETSRSGMLLLDNTGTIIFHNKRSCKILKTNQSMVHKNINDFLKPSSHSENYIADINNNFENIEFTLTNPTYKTSVLVSVSIVYDSNHKPSGKVVIMDEAQKVHRLATNLTGRYAFFTFDSIIGESPEIKSAKAAAKTMANSTSNVLILGESGTGKELFAQAIHNASDRADKPFIAINCGALPKSLIESELFGYAPGAFTGASKNGQPGKFELANGGTIFLDEIGDMPFELQISLLRVLQTRTITRLGDSKQRNIDVRIITATNVNLLQAIDNKEFRSDLYYRLNVLSITLPPLRDRISDIPLLSLYFLEQKNARLKKNVSAINPDALNALCQYQWPGNTRELENVIERAVNLAEDTRITLEHLPEQIAEHSHISVPKSLSTINEENTSFVTVSSPPVSNKQQLLLELTSALQSENGNVSKVAERLNMSRRTLYRKLEKYQINIDDYRF